MSEPLCVPRLGMSATEATLVEWTVASGTRVKAGEVVAVIETDKVETELESPASGTLVTAGEPGAVYPVGAVIAEVVS